MSEREALLVIPTDPAELIRWYSFSEADLSLIRQRRGDGNRLGFAIQMCLLRHPGTGLAPDMGAAAGLVEWAAGEIGADPGSWELYGAREETRREHLLELRSYLGLKPFGLAEFKAVGAALDELADRTDKLVALAERALEILRQRSVVVPGIGVVDRMCSAALTRANRRLYGTLAGALDARTKHALDRLLRPMEGRSVTALTWLRGTPSKASSPQMLEHLARLRAWRDVGLPDGIAVSVHQNRLLKLARAPTPPSFRPHPRHSSHRPLEHVLSRTSHHSPPRARPRTTPLTAGLGTHQPHRRLHLALQHPRHRPLPPLRKPPRTP